MQRDSVRIRSGESGQESLMQETGFYSIQKAGCIWMSSREKGGHIWQRGRCKCMKLGQGEHVWGSTRRPADGSRTFLLLSGARLTGKSRLDYGEPWIISKERFFFLCSVGRNHREYSRLTMLLSLLLTSVFVITNWNETLGNEEGCLI